MRVDDAKLQRFKCKKLRNFYKTQNRVIDKMLHNLSSRYKKLEANTDEEKGPMVPDRVGNRGGERSSEIDTPLVSIAITGSLALNVVLLCLKVAAAVTTGSITIIASTVDSALDLVSGYVLHLTQRLIASSDPYKYPQGRKRLEPVGIVIFACIMSLAAIQVIIEAFKQLMYGFITGEPDDLGVGVFGFVVLGLTIGLKLLMYFFCRFVKEKYRSTSSDAYAQDHLNDCMTNTIGILAVIIAVSFPYLWFFDGAGGIIISLWIIYSWLETAKEQIQNLTGLAANPFLLQQITHAAFCHHKLIQKVDTVRGYHFGEGFLVEVDIVMDEKTALKDAHDVGESLQIKLEEMEEVERAFVHLDYEWDHAPEHCL